MYLISVGTNIAIFFGNFFVKDLAMAFKFGIVESVLYLYHVCMMSIGHFLCYSIAGSKFRQGLKQKICCACCE